MKITCDPKSVRITAGQNNRLATASITLDNAFVVRNISVMNGSKGIFVNMPSQKGVDAEGNTKYFDTAFPLSKELRDGEVNADDEDSGEQSLYATVTIILQDRAQALRLAECENTSLHAVFVTRGDEKLKAECLKAQLELLTGEISTEEAD